MGLRGEALQDWLIESGHDLVAVAGAVADLLADECRVAAVDNAERLVDLAAIEQRLQVASVRALSAFDVSGEYVDLGSCSAIRFLSHWCRFTGAEASARRRAAVAWRRYDDVAVALTHGEITMAHVHRFARAADRGREALFEVCQADLVEIAKGAESFAVFVRAIEAWIAAADDLLDNDEPADRYERRHLQLTTTLAGMLLVRGRLSEEQRDVVLEAFEHAARRDREIEDGATDLPRTRGQLMADALTEMCQRYLDDVNAGTRGVHGPVVSTTLVISPAMVAEWLAEHADDLPSEIVDLFDPAAQAGTDDGPPARKGRHPDHDARDDRRGPPPVTPLGLSGDELREIANHPTDRLGRLAAEILRTGPVHASTAALLACDSWIGATMFTAGGEVLHHGRRHRLFTPAQRQALALRDGGCVFPGCDRGLEWCDAHHLSWWEGGGPTDIDNGALLCRHHHTKVHQGWTLTRSAGGTWDARRPPQRLRRPPDPVTIDQLRHTLRRTRNHLTTNRRLSDHIEAVRRCRPPPEPVATAPPAGGEEW